MLWNISEFGKRRIGMVLDEGSGLAGNFIPLRVIRNAAR
jgi:hypothetical protein